jgi:hypothetical protein
MSNAAGGTNIDYIHACFLLLVIELNALLISAGSPCHHQGEQQIYARFYEL